MAEYQDTEAETVPFVLRRRSPEARAAYIAEKAPVIAQRFNCTEAEARLLLEGVATGSVGVDELPEPNKPEVTPAEGSISFVLKRIDDETLNFSIEFGPAGDDGEPAGEDITTVTHDEHGFAGIELISDTVKSIGEALGIEVVER